jgi:quinol monooxygenase YgiN
MKTITVIATFQARPGKETELRDALLKLIVPTRKEEGCINYDLHQAADDPAKFLFHENWTNRAALDAHMKSMHVQELIPRVGELCMEFPQIRTWEKLPQ